MKVKELIAQLEKLDPESLVVCYSEDEKLSSFRGPVTIFEINDVSQTKAEMMRTKSGVPGLKFEDNERSTKLAIIDLTSDC
jgi:hypothetical protein